MEVCSGVWWCVEACGGGVVGCGGGVVVSLPQNNKVLSAFRSVLRY